MNFIFFLVTRCNFPKSNLSFVGAYRNNHLTLNIHVLLIQRLSVIVYILKMFKINIKLYILFLYVFTSSYVLYFTYDGRLYQFTCITGIDFPLCPIWREHLIIFLFWTPYNIFFFYQPTISLRKHKQKLRVQGVQSRFYQGICSRVQAPRYMSKRNRRKR